jgi:hypothetical protein
MAIYRGLGGAGSNEQDASITVITTKALEAATSATNAATSASAASTSASNAATSETNAATSASNASSSSSSALASKEAALASAGSAASSASSAASSASNASSSASAAATSESNAATSETNAAASEAATLAIYGNTTAMNAAVAAAATSETNAAASESAAASSETNAATSASNASVSAGNAASSATAASNSASAASTSASNALASESAAASSATNAAASESAAAGSASAASTSASEAATSETNASTSETNAAASASAASASESNASASASAAATSESNAATSATNAANSASAASTSATNAAASETAAAASEAAAAASFDAFDDRYLGSKTSDPSVDNDGNALLTGALYFDSVTGVMKVWSGSNWIAAYASLSGAMFASNNLSDVASISTSRSNLGLGTTSNVVFNQLETTNGLIVGGDLTVNGTLSTINTENLAVSDNMIYLNEGSTITNPDLGWSGNYNDGTYAHAGVFRDATDGRYKFYDGYTPEPGVEINTGHASFNLASVQAGTFYGALSGNASTATALQTSRTISLTGDVSGSASFNGTTDATITAVVADDSHSHSTATITGLDAALTSYAPKASPALTGTPTAPTAAVGTNTTQLATTAFVNSEIANDAPTKTGGGASGTWGINITGNANYATTAGSAPASDVYSWAKAASKPSYTYSEVGAPSTTGTNASGTWGINITGNANTATTAANGGVTSVNGSTGAVTISVPPAFDSGTVMLFHQTSAPTGWTKATNHTDKAIRVVNGSVGAGGSNGFAAAFGTPTVTGSVSLSGSVGATTLSESQIPSHRHLVINSGYANIIAGWGYPVTASNQVASAYQGQGYENYHLQAHSSDANAGRSSATGGGGSHDHSFSGSGSLGSASASINVAYIDVIIAIKN